MSPRADHAWTFAVPLWRWREGTWHFVTVPADVSDTIDEVVGDATGGFGSVRVEVRVGGSVWRTSLFPSSEEQAFVLPVKKSVRSAEGLAEGEPVALTVRLIDRWPHLLLPPGRGGGVRGREGRVIRPRRARSARVRHTTRRPR